MNLQFLEADLPKNLDIKANSIEVKTLEADSAEITDMTVDAIELKSLTLSNQASVPNPAATFATVYSNSSSQLSLTNSSGTTFKYTASTAVTPVDGDIPVFNGTTGTLIKNSSIPSASVVIGPASVTTDRLAAFDGTTGKLLKESTLTTAQLVPYTGATSAPNLGTFSLLAKGGQPPSLMKFVNYNNLPGLTNTITETSLLSVTAQGNLVYAANSLSVGSCLRITAGCWAASVLAATTLTIRFKAGPTTLLTLAWEPGAISNIGAILEMAVCIKDDGTTTGSSKLLLDAANPIITRDNSTFSTTGANTFDITGQWSAADPADQFNFDYVFIESLQQP